ncbi:MAG: Sua5/YciO/YrdC/YwlC family protein [Chloroflexota bacterium]
MSTRVLDIGDLQALEKTADLLAAGELIIVYFNGTYAFLCDADQIAPAEKLFALKKRPLTQTLALVADPSHLPDFVDQTHPAFVRFPPAQAITLQQQVHALGIIYPANVATAPPDIVQAGTILNVWTEYEVAKRPFARLNALVRARGLRGFKGASTNLSGEATYHSLDQVLAAFGGHVPVILDSPQRVEPARRKSTTMIDLTRETAVLVREGSVSAAEIQHHINQVGFGKLTIASNLKTL